MAGTIKSQGGSSSTEYRAIIVHTYGGTDLAKEVERILTGEKETVKRLLTCRKKTKIRGKMAEAYAIMDGKKETEFRMNSDNDPTDKSMSFIIDELTKKITKSKVCIFIVAADTVTDEWRKFEIDTLINLKESGILVNLIIVVNHGTPIEMIPINLINASNQVSPSSPRFSMELVNALTASYKSPPNSSPLTSLDPTNPSSGDLTLNILKSGYPLAIFLQSPDPKNLCSQCQLVLRLPRQSMCGHRFCSPCIEELSKKGEKCAPCFEEESVEYFLNFVERSFPDAATRRDLRRLEVACINENCQWKGRLGDYEDHMETCEYQQMACTKCGIIMLRSHLDDHIRTKCDMRDATCKFCKTIVPFKQLEPEHFKICELFPCKCEVCGKKKIPRNKMEQHKKNECAGSSDLCEFDCNMKIEKQKVDKHNQENITKHLDILLEKVIELRNGDTKTTFDHVEKLMNTVEKIEKRMKQIEEKIETSLGASGMPSATSESKKIEDLERRVEELEKKVSNFETVAAVLNREIKKSQEKLQQHEVQVQNNLEVISTLTTKITDLERIAAMKDIKLRDVETKFKELELTSYDGTLTWCIDDFNKKRKDAMSGMAASFYSPPFYSERHGYKMCLRIYLNGDGLGKKTHVSLYFVLLKGPYDGIQKWPFQHKVTFIMIDQGPTGAHLIDAFRPDATSASFKRPTTAMNVASGCPLFCALSQIDNKDFAYYKNDTMYIRVRVEE
ncbi:unnamed protein product [Owenia fusiformis]|uniref:Uncharacterized protein n=1 Tax=Owenia fusiformis TaxID=6347 RepID=A0A8J1U0J6_OWEFU|nr:unnamed protein product [Owenia fusiformis]